MYSLSRKYKFIHNSACSAHLDDTGDVRPTSTNFCSLNEALEKWFRQWENELDSGEMHKHLSSDRADSSSKRQ